MPIVLVALCLNPRPSLAEYDDIYLQCEFSGFKSLYSSPKIFKIARDGYAYDGPTKMKLNLERMIDSYLFGRTINNDEVLMYSIDIFNGDWSEYIITKDEIFRIKNDEEILKTQVNSYAGLNWRHIGACKSIDKKF